MPVTILLSPEIERRNVKAMAHVLEIVSWVALALGALSALWMLGEMVAGRAPKMAVMGAVWPVTALYLGPVAVWLRRRVGSKPVERKSMAEKSALAVTHCGAGCTLGDITAECIVFWTAFRIGGDAIWPELILDFAAAWLLGIVFQYFTIAPMRGAHGWSGVKMAIKADTLSLAAFEVGLFAWMLVMRFVLFPSDPLHPNDAAFWFLMQVGMIVGFLTSWPVNGWLLRRGLKEAM